MCVSLCVSTWHTWNCRARPRSSKRDWTLTPPGTPPPDLRPRKPTRCVHLRRVTRGWVLPRYSAAWRLLLCTPGARKGVFWVLGRPGHLPAHAPRRRSVAATASRGCWENNTPGGVRARPRRPLVASGQHGKAHDRPGTNLAVAGYRVTPHRIVPASTCLPSCCTPW